MAIHISKVFFLLCMISTGYILFFVSWGHFSETVGLFFYPSGHRGDQQFFKSTLKVFDGREHPADLTAAFSNMGGKSNMTQLPVEAETPMPVLSRKAFKKLPVWGFEDVYNQDAAPHPTTCAQSLRNSKDEAFKKVFLPNIRLYLHKDNVNMSEWNRLSHFNTPFGFMDFNYDEVMPVLKLIPVPKEPLLLPKPGGDGCIHCAVVGAGGILNGSKMGAEIDAHDYVFRMNTAITKGHEEDVGNKTSVYVHTKHSMVVSLPIFNKYGHKAAPHDEGIKYVMIPEGLSDYPWLQGLIKGEKSPAGPNRFREPRKYYSGQYNETRFYVLHHDFLRYVRHRFLTSRKHNTSIWYITRPSNGAFTLFFALHTCDTVDAYGFMTEDYKKYSNYYVDKLIKTKDTSGVYHDYLLERDWWYRFHQSKIIRLYQRNEPETQTQKPK